MQKFFLKLANVNALGILTTTFIWWDFVENISQQTYLEITMHQEVKVEPKEKELESLEFSLHRFLWWVIGPKISFVEQQRAPFGLFSRAMMYRTLTL